MYLIVFIRSKILILGLSKVQSGQRIRLMENRKSCIPRGRETGFYKTD
jgi:hypothetical protein